MYLDCIQTNGADNEVEALLLTPVKQAENASGLGIYNTEPTVNHKLMGILWARVGAKGCIISPCMHSSTR